MRRLLFSVVAVLLIFSIVHAEEVEQPSYVPGELIVKVIPEVGAAFYDALQAESFATVLPQASSLDKLNTYFGLRKARRVFKMLEQKDSEGRYAGFKTAAQHISEVKARNPKLADRGKRGAVIPDLENYFLLKLNPAIDVRYAAMVYRNDENVISASPNYIATISGSAILDDPLMNITTFYPSDTYFDTYGSWGQDFYDLYALQPDRMNMVEAWNTAGVFGEGIIVAVLDVGIDYRHPDLDDNLWVNDGEDINHDGIVEGERFDDFGSDGLFNRHEPGHDYETNPDPNGDNYDLITNPTGTERNGLWDSGEFFYDHGLDTIGPDDSYHVSSGGPIAPDAGEGNGIWDAGDKNGVDDDGNGYIDDLYGIDTAMVDSDPFDYDGGVIPYDGGFHGTFVAGSVAAEANDIGIIGVAPAATVMAVKLMPSTGAFTPIPSSINALAEAIYYAAVQGARVLNNSWALGPEDDVSAVLSAIDVAHDAFDCVVVFAAGNSNSDIFRDPLQSSPKTIAVAGSNYNDDKYFKEGPGSSHGEAVDVAAPGQDILSLESSSLGPHNFSAPPGPGPYGDSYFAASGTSAAAPHVAGLAALILSLQPDLDPEEVRTILASSTDPLGDVHRFPLPVADEVYLGTGRINAACAVLAALDPPEAVSEITSLSYMQPLGGDTISVEGSATGISYGVSDASFSAGPYPDPEEWELIGEGGSVINGQLASFDTTDIDSGRYYVKVNALDATGLEITDRVRIIVDKDIPSGWPKQVSDRVVSSPVVADFDADGDNEVLVLAYDAIAYLFHHDGTLDPNWPIRAFITDSDIVSTPAVFDLDGDLDLEIVFSHRDHIKAVHHDGTVIWYKSFGLGFTAGSPSIGDINGDGSPEIVYPYHNLEKTEVTIQVLDTAGNVVEPWPYVFTGTDVVDLDERHDSTVALADLDQDGDDEVIVAFSTEIGNRRDYVITALDENAEPLSVTGSIWPRTFNLYSGGHGSPTVGDVDRDGDLEVFVKLRSRIFGLDHLGNELDGWTQNLFQFAPNISLADFDGNGDLEIILQKDKSPFQIRAYDHDGSEKQEWNFDNQYWLETHIPSLPIRAASVTIGDVSGDGLADVVTGYPR
ncbi:S8 family serine peptidase, partial [Candidatus Omnitrophota bacterium]